MSTCRTPSDDSNTSQTADFPAPICPISTRTSRPSTAYSLSPDERVRRVPMARPSIDLKTGPRSLRQSQRARDTRLSSCCPAAAATTSRKAGSRKPEGRQRPRCTHARASPIYQFLHVLAPCLLATYAFVVKPVELLAKPSPRRIEQLRRLDHAEFGLHLVGKSNAFFLRMSRFILADSPAHQRLRTLQPALDIVESGVRVGVICVRSRLRELAPQTRQSRVEFLIPRARRGREHPKELHHGAACNHADRNAVPKPLQTRLVCVPSCMIGLA